MKNLLMVLVLLLVVSVAYAGPTRGLLVDNVQPINPAQFTASLSAIQPIWVSGNLDKITVTAGLEFAIPQPKDAVLALITPDRLVGFWAVDDITSLTKPGGSLDWALTGQIDVTVVGVVDRGIALGIKTDLVSTSF